MLFPAKSNAICFRDLGAMSLVPSSRFNWSNCIRSLASQDGIVGYQTAGDRSADIKTDGSMQPSLLPGKAVDARFGSTRPGSGAAVPAVAANRPLLLQLQSSRRTSANH